MDYPLLSLWYFMIFDQIQFFIILWLGWMLVRLLLGPTKYFFMAIVSLIK